MKVCILSMQRVPNMGSLLQSYALKRTIESLGNDVSFIDIEKADNDYELLEGHYIKVDNNTNGLSRFIQKAKKIDRYTLQRIQNKNKAKEQRAIFQQFSHDYLQLDIASNDEHFDYCVIGSDEVFNCCSFSPWGLTSQLFGNVRQADHVITYAASCGFTKVNMLTSDAKACISSALQKLEGVSVRDTNTFEFVQTLGIKNAVYNLDPVLIHDFDNDVASVTLPQDFPSNACIIYAYYDRIQNPAEIKSILSFCRKNHLVPVAIGAPQMWVKKYYTLTPFQVLKAISCAKFVITDTFHGTIFSAKYAEDFAVIVRDNNSNKLVDLLNRLEIGNHLVGQGRTIDDVSKMATNKSRIREILSRERELSLKYLQRYLTVGD